MGDHRLHAFGDDALGDHDAVGLVAELRAGRVSRREVVEAAIARTRLLDVALDAVAAERFGTAKAEAGDEHTGFFAGLPTFIKDNSDLAGLPTQQGTRAFVGAPVACDGDVARLFATIGTTALGKTRLSEYGFGPSPEFAEEPPVRNPWDTRRISGASSAGSAALVAGGAVPFAHANDGGGSIRIPAACCGLVGLKPTRGRTPSDKANREMPVQIVHDGVVTRSVRDSAAFLREAERAYRDLRLPPVGDVTHAATPRLRIGVVRDSITGTPTDEETREAVERTAGRLADLGHVVEDAELPPMGSFADDFLLYWGFLAVALTRAGRLRFGPTYDRSRNDALTLGLARHATRNAWKVPGAITRLRRGHHLTEPLFTTYDAVLTPVLSHTTPEVGWFDPHQGYDVVVERILEWVNFTPLQNVTGEPAISVPVATSAVGSPIGVQLSAARGYDRRLLELAFELEEATPFARIQD